MALTSKRKQLAYGFFSLYADGNFSYEDIAKLISNMTGQSVAAKQMSPTERASVMGIPTDTGE